MAGHVEVSGKVAYAPQQAWIMNATVKVGQALAPPCRSRGRASDPFTHVPRVSEPNAGARVFQENILFGNPFDLAAYRAALQSCCLTQDLEILPVRAPTGALALNGRGLCRP